jgi:hypothetical protein
MRRQERVDALGWPTELPGLLEPEGNASELESEFFRDFAVYKPSERRRR